MTSITGPLTLPCTSNLRHVIKNNTRHPSGCNDASARRQILVRTRFAFFHLLRFLARSACVSCVGVSLGSCAQWQGLMYSGDGRIRTHEIFEPKFELFLPPVDFTHAGEYRYSLRGIPGEEYDFYFGQESDPVRVKSLMEEVASANPRIHLTIIQSSDRVLFEVEGFVTDWSPRAGIHGAFYYTPAPRVRIRFESCSDYTMTITVRPDREGEESVLLIPTFGGGNVGNIL